MNWPSYRQALFRGVNEQVDDFLIANEESSSCKNCRLDETGSLRSRNGRATRNTVAIIGTPNVLALHRFRMSGGTNKFLAYAGMNIWLGDEDSPYNFTSIKSGLTNNTKWRFLTFKDKVFGVNGSNTNFKYDGTNELDMGVETPGKPTVALGSGDGLDGDYYYKISYQVDSYSEGNASVASDLIQPETQAVTVSRPAGYEEDVTHWIIYRTKASGSIYYKVATVAIGTATYSDTIADDSLDTGTIAPTDNGAPAVNADFIALHHRYIFLVDKDTSRLYFSVQDYPEKFPAAYYFDVNPKDGENINGIMPVLGGLWIFKKNAIYFLGGNDDTDFGIPSNKFSNYGCYAPDTLVNCSLAGKHVILYLHKTGIRGWDGTNSDLISAKIQPTIDTILDDYIDKACACLKGEEYWISFCTSGTSNNETWIFNLRTGDWRKYDYGMNAMCVWPDARLFSGQNSGWVYQEDTGTQDITSDISWEYYTKNYSFPHEMGNLNRYREMILWTSLATDDLSIQFTVDNDATNKRWTKTLSSIGSTLVKKRFSLPQYLAGELMKIKFSSSGKNQAEIRQLELRRQPILRR